LKLNINFNFILNFKRLGEEIIIDELNINIKARYTDWKFFNSKEDAFDYIINPDDTILMHGGGNFGDIWRIHSDYRNKFIARFKDNKFVVFPQTINYQNQSLIKKDYKKLLQNNNLYIMTRCLDSHDFAKKNFPKITSMYVPDPAFMLGPLRPISEPIYDILILRRTDKESKFQFTEWEASYLEILSFRYTYLDVDWYFFKEEKYLYMSNYYKDDYPITSPNTTIHIQEILDQRKLLVNRIMSQGRIIVTDRMHASIYGLLLGKVHIIVDDLYKKIFNTRESAFSDKFECRPEFLRSYYAFSPKDAVKKAVEILNSEDFFD
jgi:exopolysaccharide biosynthesis predicted pyruvyltransferase EpsI